MRVVHQKKCEPFISLAYLTSCAEWVRWLDWGFRGSVNPFQEQPTEASDQELIAAINSGDESAFEILYYRYRDWVAGLAFRFTADSEMALDVMQETFLYLARKFPGFILTAQLKTFLYPAVRNLSIAARRRRDRFSSDETASATLEQIPNQAPDGQGSDTVIAVLDIIPEEQRDVLLLRFVDGLSLNEIATALEIPLGTVKSRLHNALGKLRQDVRTKKLFEE